MSDPLKDYRNQLVVAEQKAQEDFDKTVISLSGGALGVSFVFLKDVVASGPVNHKTYLLAAWMFWGVSITAVLASFFASTLALRRAIRQVDDNTVYDSKPGAMFAPITNTLNRGVGISAWCAALSRAPSLAPPSDDFITHPKGQASTPNQCFVILTPVTETVGAFGFLAFHTKRLPALPSP